MVFFKNFLVVLLVLSTINLCLAKPRWEWFGEEANDETLMEKWKKKIPAQEPKEKRGKCEITANPHCPWWTCKC